MRELITYSASKHCFTMLSLVSITLNAQEVSKQTTSNITSPFIINKEKIFKPFAALELWATYSFNEKKEETEYANRGDVSFRRLRFGASGSPYAWLSYNFQLHFDRLGEDNFASTKGAYSGIDIWNAYITAKLLRKTNLVNLHAGYYLAAISREFNTSPWTIGSFDKTRAVWYMRNFITGTGNGIESGIGLGGLKKFEKFGISYRIGTYEPQAYASSKYPSRLYTGRFMFSLGNAEQNNYKYMLSGNQWETRKGITLGVGGSTQSNGKLTDSTFFNTSAAYGADILLNYKGFRIDGEYFIFNRNSDIGDFNGIEWHIRFGYNFVINKRYIEPVIAYDNYEGKGSKNLYKYIGDDNTLDMGINWYLNQDKLKLSLHYIIQNGSVSSNIGDYLGMAFQFKL